MAEQSWNEARMAYLLGEESPEALAARLGLSRRAVLRRYRTEDWARGREAVRVGARALCGVLDRQEGGELRVALRRAALCMAQSLRDAAQGEEAFRLRVVQDKAAPGGLRQELLPVPDLEALKTASATLKNLTAIAKELYAPSDADVPEQLMISFARPEEEQWGD